MGIVRHKQEYEIEVINASSLKYLPGARVKRLARIVFEGEGISEAAVSIVYLDDEEIRRLNKKYLNHDYVTDVLSFDLGDMTYFDGEIYIGARQAKRQAEEYGVSQSNEIMRLAIHGILHLAGYDDNSAVKRDMMSSLEAKYLKLMKMC